MPNPIKRTIHFKKPSEELRPWMLGFKPTVKIYDRPYPYSTDGYISKEGWFFQCDPGGHSSWCSILGVSPMYLESLGWVAVWSYTSIFDAKYKTKTPKFRFSSEVKLTKAQKNTMLSWCATYKISIEDACVYSYAIEEFKG
jgi:hypothetical protein